MSGVNPAYMAGQPGHGTKVFFKGYASWISSKQDISEMAKIEGKLGSMSSEPHQKKTATRK